MGTRYLEGGVSLGTNTKDVCGPKRSSSARRQVRAPSSWGWGGSRLALPWEGVMMMGS